jgi:hypothetical protein
MPDHFTCPQYYSLKKYSFIPIAIWHQGASGELSDPGSLTISQRQKQVAFVALTMVQGSSPL